MIRRLLHLWPLLLLTGCGPLMSPMLPRLSAEKQHEMDQAWDNLLTPTDRVSRQTLLDTTVAFYMYVFGADRLYVRSEKYISHGKVIMEIDCERAAPESDEFRLTIVDERGRTLRRERYSRAEVEESDETMLRATLIQNGVLITSAQQGAHTTPRSTTQPDETPEGRARRLEGERRLRAAIAATQPARLKTH